MSEAMAVDNGAGFEAFDLVVRRPFYQQNASSVVQTYISEYTSRTRIRRLLFIAEKCSGRTLELEAYRLAVNFLKEAYHRTDLFSYLIFSASGDRCRQVQ